MSVSARTEYACTALLELALHFESGQPVRVREIAAAHGIPPQFLVQILLQLKAAGLVASTRGAAGGYRLVREPNELSLGEVMSVIEGPPQPASGNAVIQTPLSRALQKTWRRAAASERELLDSTSFADLIEAVREPAEHMFYI
jgi:Rrf2 family protein